MHLNIKMTVRMTANLRQQMVERSRRQDQAREDSLKQLHRENLEDAQIMADERVQDKRLLRAMQEMQREQDMQESLLRAERNRILKDQQVAQEENLARELERRKLEQTRDEKMRQQIRETSLELRELESKLKAAYMNKERAAQIAEKDAHKYDEMKRDAEIARMMKEENERASGAEQEREMERYKEMVRYQQELERQLEEQEMKKQKAYEEFLKEKLMIDEIVRKIYEEDQKEIEREMRKQQMTQQYINEFKKSREEWKLRERERMEEENRKIMEYASLQRERDEAHHLAMKEREEAMGEVQKALAEEISRRDNERVEMERVRLELHLEEQEEKEREKEKMAVERRIRQKVELQSQHAQQMHFKALRVQAEQDEEEQFRQQMLAKYAEDDRIEQMNAQKRRMKQAEHKRSVEGLLEQRRAQYAEEREREVAERLEDKRMEDFRKNIVEEERRRLLQEHATRLLGYLPKGVIQGQEDLDMLGPEFRQAYTRRQIDPFDENAWDHPR